MSKTRLKALMKQIESGQMETDSARILDYIMMHGMTSRPIISDVLGIPEKTVSARVSMLLDIGVLEVVEHDSGDKPDYEILRYQRDAMRQVANAHERKRKKFISWKKRGLKEFSDFLNEEQLKLKF